MPVQIASLGQPAMLHDGVSQLGTPRNPLVVRTGGKPTFRIVAPDIAPANNKYMFVLFNTSTVYDMVVQAIYVKHTNLTAATGVIIKQSLLRISAFTTGAAVANVIADDPETDLIATYTGFSFDTGSSAVSDLANGVIDPGIIVTGEEGILAATALQVNRYNLNGQKIYERRDGERGITLSGTTAANRGLAVKNLINDTEGFLSYVAVVTAELTSGANS